MFCTRCGKEIEAGELCYDCYQKRQAETALREPVMNYAAPVNARNAEQVAAEKQGSVMAGFGRALAAAIVSEFAATFGIVCYMFTAMSGIFESDFAEGFLIGIQITNIIFTLPLAIVSMVLAVGSIRFYKATVKDPNVKKPIVSLILGIVALVGSIVAFQMMLLGSISALTLL